MFERLVSKAAEKTFTLSPSTRGIADNVNAVIPSSPVSETEDPRRKYCKTS